MDSLIDLGKYALEISFNINTDVCLTFKLTIFILRRFSIVQIIINLIKLSYV